MYPPSVRHYKKTSKLWKSGLTVEFMSSVTSCIDVSISFVQVIGIIDQLIQHISWAYNVVTWYLQMSPWDSSNESHECCLSHALYAGHNISEPAVYVITRQQWAYVHRQSVVQCSDMVLLFNSRSGRLGSDFNFDFPQISMEASLFHENTLKHSSVDILLLYTHIRYINCTAQLQCRTPLRHSVEVTKPEMGCCEWCEETTEWMWVNDSLES